MTLPSSSALTPLFAPDESLLFGRASEVDTIVWNCIASRLTVITTAPGLGLSSLLRAGVVPALRRNDFITIVFSDWQARSFAARFRDAIVSATQQQVDDVPGNSDTLCDLLEKAQAKTHRPLALLLDQFEDYLRYHSGTDASDDFDAELARAISTRAARFVIGLHQREVHTFQRLSPYVPNLMGFSIRLAPISQDAAMELIHSAAVLAGMEEEPEAVVLLITAPMALVPVPAAAPGVHPLLVKLGAERLFAIENQAKSKIARASTIVLNGGADRLILQSLDPVIDGLGSSRAKLFFRWIPLLIAQDGHRLMASEEALVEYDGSWNGMAASVLPLLLRRGLLRTVEVPMGIRYELAHESMAVIIQDWWTRKTERRRTVLRAILVSIAVAVILAAYLAYIFLIARDTPPQ